MGWTGWLCIGIVAVVIVFTVGYFIGKIVADETQHAKSMGMLVINASESEEPELFTELYETLDIIGSHKYVVFEVYDRTQK